MRFALALLIAPVLAAAPAGKPAPKKEAGAITLGAQTYRFKPESLSASASKPMALYLRGQLVPEKGGKALSFSFQLFRPGPLGGMTLGPRVGKGAQWQANMQTRIDADFPNPPKLGDEATFTFSGPLLKLENGKSTELSWQGKVTAAFTSVP